MYYFYDENGGHQGDYEEEVQERVNNLLEADEVLDLDAKVGH